MGKGRVATDMNIQQSELGDLKQRQPRGPWKGNWATSYHKALFSVVRISLHSVPTIQKLVVGVLKKNSISERQERFGYGPNVNSEAKPPR